MRRVAPKDVMSRTALLLLTTIASFLVACGGGGSLRDGVYRDAEATYRVGELPDAWSRIDFSGNDLAWTDGAGSVIAVNAVCEGHGDPSLEVLTQHLLLGFDERHVIEREPMRIDGRGALRTRANASLDGVPVEMELTLVKKDGCVYDMIYTAPAGRFGVRAADYRQLVERFAVGAGE